LSNAKLHCKLGYVQKFTLKYYTKVHFDKSETISFYKLIYNIDVTFS